MLYCGTQSLQAVREKQHAGISVHHAEYKRLVPKQLFVDPCYCFGKRFDGSKTSNLVGPVSWAGTRKCTAVLLDGCHNDLVITTHFSSSKRKSIAMNRNCSQDDLLVVPQAAAHVLQKVCGRAGLLEHIQCHVQVFPELITGKFEGIRVLMNCCSHNICIVSHAATCKLQGPAVAHNANHYNFFVCTESFACKLQRCWTFGYGSSNEFWVVSHLCGCPSQVQWVSPNDFSDKWCWVLKQLACVLERVRILLGCSKHNTRTVLQFFACVLKKHAVALHQR